MKHFLFIHVIAAVLVFSGCTSVQLGIGSNEKESDAATETNRVSLSWENTTEPHPERASWSEKLINEFNDNWDVYNSAKDATRFCPRYSTLSKSGKLKAWGEFFVSIALYESGFNPKSSSVDVGTSSDRGSFSDGLYQVSENDQEWVKGKRWYSYEELLTALPNIDLASAIAVRQIKATGLIILPNSSKYRYWAVILDGNKYSKVDKIIDRTKQKAPDCVK